MTLHNYPRYLGFRYFCFEKDTPNFKIFNILFSLFYRLRQKNFLHILWRLKWTSVWYTFFFVSFVVSPSTLVFFACFVLFPVTFNWLGDLRWCFPCVCFTWLKVHGRNPNHLRSCEEGVIFISLGERFGIHLAPNHFAQNAKFHWVH